MKRPLRLAGIKDESAKFRDSYPFPSAAASALKPSAPMLPPGMKLPCPFSHPENLAPRGPKIGTAHSSKVSDGATQSPGSSSSHDPAHPANLLGIMPTHDLLREIDRSLDRITTITNDLREQVDTLPFPGDDDHPRAA